MKNPYVIFAVKVNALIILFSIALSFILIPLLAYTLNALDIQDLEMVTLEDPRVIAVVWIYGIIFSFIAAFAAFRIIYLKDIKKKKLKLSDCIKYSIVLAIIIEGVLHIITGSNFFQNFYYFISLVLSLIFTAVAFYYAGRSVEKITHAQKSS